MTNTLTQTPELPLAGELYSPNNYDDVERTVLQSIWSTEEPEEDGIYTAYLLTLNALDPQHPIFEVLFICCEIGTNTWDVLDEWADDSIVKMAKLYSERSTDDV